MRRVTVRMDMGYDLVMMLPLLIVVPLVGALALLLMVPKSKPQGAAPLAFIFSLIPAAMAVALVACFTYTGNVPGEWQFAFEYDWLGKSFGTYFHLGMDSISLWLVVLTAFL